MIVFEKGVKKEVKIFSRVKKDFLIRDEEVVLQRNIILEDDVTIHIDDGGELLIL